MQQHKFNIILRVKLLIINECHGVTGQTGGTVGLEVKTRLAPATMDSSLFILMAGILCRILRALFANLSCESFCSAVRLSLGF